jgi:hypothetical protein
MPRVAAPKDAKQLYEEALAELDAAMARLDSIARGLKKTYKKIQQSQKPAPPAA